MSALRRALGHTDYRSPVHSEADYNAMVRVLLRLAATEDRVRGRIA